MRKVYENIKNILIFFFFKFQMHPYDQKNFEVDYILLSSLNVVKYPRIGMSIYQFQTLKYLNVTLNLYQL